MRVKRDQRRTVRSRPPAGTSCRETWGWMTKLVRLVLIMAAWLAVAAAAPSAIAATGIHNIKHVVLIMQENRSFDSYFGTFPGADGIPRNRRGQFTVCVPNPVLGTCEKPYHDPSDVNAGGPHMAVDAIADISGGKMDGFIASAQSGHRTRTSWHARYSPLARVST